MSLLIAMAAMAATQGQPAAEPRVEKASVVCSWEVSKTGSPYKVCATRSERELRTLYAQMALREQIQRATQTRPRSR